MAKTTRAKKTKAVPEINVGKEVFESFRELEKLKGIPVEYMVDRLKQALTNAYRKDREDHRDVPAENVDFGKTVLMPGDPLRAKFIAETYLENPVP